MTTLDSKTLGSMLADAVNNQDIDTIWWVIDELEGKHENSQAVHT